MWKNSLERIREMVRKEFLQLFRDPRMWAIVFVAPLLQLVVFGYAVSTDIRHTATFVVDNSRSQESRDLVEALTASGYFDVIGQSGRLTDVVRQQPTVDVRPDRGRSILFKEHYVAMAELRQRIAPARLPSSPPGARNG